MESAGEALDPNLYADRFKNVCIHILYMHVHESIYLYLYIDRYICPYIIHIYVYVCMCVRVYLYIYICFTDIF